MKTLCAIIIACLTLVSHATAEAQTRGRRATGQRSRPASSGRATRGDARSASVTAEARSRVSDQIKLLTRFLYLFGRISAEIESAEAQGRTGASRAQSDRTKESLRQNLQNVREGLDQLEAYFRTTPQLERYQSLLAGVTAGAADAEDRAASGQLDEAGRTLLEVVNRLTDALAEMN